MTILVIAEHDNAILNRSTHATVGAAALIATFTGVDVHVLVAGHCAWAAAEAATQIAGVSKVIFADLRYTSNVAEATEMTVGRIACSHSRILAPATTDGTRLASRVAARLGVALIDDMTGVLDAETFERAVEVGGASPTARSLGPLNVITVNVDAFDAAASEGGGASIHKIGEQDTHRSQYTAHDERQRTSYGPGQADQRRSARLSQATTFKALSDKLEIAVGASRAFHERLRLRRYSCLD
ncbi:adenine nucleotide alpha hydrolase family protein [Paraburkholderia kirstenboschensis]|uniref:Electron transfer flavoprotein subunit alpha/FixB family protein n=1 Tax=Paraburkholderia kirstenboschensis TaxID=1245436 RepID=A0ABZ0EA47_9BURK|nr:electron transfer flavoprotein subunit alpha/FixB family protein [Paraburkholderia kirstenboschensis]WOD14126.1 electron transfer flavoprotein subunit alpha/FixB family protein [Paraburkholderia kirstenboschensis]